MFGRQLRRLFRMRVKCIQLEARPEGTRLLSHRFKETGALERVALGKRGQIDKGYGSPYNVFALDKATPFQ
jgi:hypothetical protein